MAQIETAIAREGGSELVIERSRFLGLALPADTEEAALAALARVRAQHPQATHHCSAWRLGPGQERQSDDGEPQGTAGVPLLETLRRRGVDYGILIVVRYYGGRKLGRPGLLRAYLGAGVAALDAAGFGRDEVVFVEVVLADLEDLPTVNAVYARHFDESKRPARTVFQAASLPHGGKVKVQAIAIHAR